jgi:hypothetical protein
LIFAYDFIWRYYLITIAASVLLIHALRVILAYVFLNVGTAQIVTIMWSLATVAAIMRDEYVTSVISASNWGEKSSNRDIIEHESPFDDSFGTAPELLSSMFVSLAKI